MSDVSEPVPTSEADRGPNRIANGIAERIAPRRQTPTVLLRLLDPSLDGSSIHPTLAQQYGGHTTRRKPLGANRLAGVRLHLTSIEHDAGGGAGWARGECDFGVDVCLWAVE